ncbi:hypothetical protein G4B88_027846 [Cannabis sativa]|uniref:Uncharacterized protein n=1 Tax=Cannabis sativa TaxID=3483 RepID=A0A7J6I7D9_CANSA|nr:hypothetical protein G4B88_027846 [Cannabis sativa]
MDTVIYSEWKNRYERNAQRSEEKILTLPTSSQVPNQTTSSSTSTPPNRFVILSSAPEFVGPIKNLTPMESNEIGHRKKEIKLHLNLSGEKERWRSIPFTYPINFETIVLDAELKTKIKQFYHRLGHVWKRSYLLYGASGTGKTSFIAAMARFFCYDGYEI